MASTYRWKAATGRAAALAATVLVGGISMGPRFALALDQQTEQRIAAGYAATQVPVDLTGKNPLQVGVGSYIVNVTGVCNHCHSVNQYYKAEYPQAASLQTGNPYYLPPPNGPYTGGIVNGQATFVIDPTTLLAGGQNFGLVLSKNLTPAPNGNVAHPTRNTPYYAEGGIDWKTYWGVLHNGVDIDQLFTQCSSGTTGPGGCLNAPSNAYVLQVMPWPAIRLLTDSDLNAVWQYLSAIPCISNASSPYPEVVHVCPATSDPSYGTAAYRVYNYVNGQVQRLE